MCFGESLLLRLSALAGFHPALYLLHAPGIAEVTDERSVPERDLTQQ